MSSNKHEERATKIVTEWDEGVVYIYIYGPHQMVGVCGLHVKSFNLHLMLVGRGY